jgi:hypothetical protein
MSIWLERFVLAFLATLGGATVLTNPWHLDRIQQSTLIVAIIALSLFAARTVEKARVTPAASLPQEQPEKEPVVAVQSAHAGPAEVPMPATEIRMPAQPNPGIALPPLHAAEPVTEHERQNSPTLKLGETRDLIINTILELQSQHKPVTVQMVIDSIESLKFRYVRAVTIIPELMSMRRDGVLTWNSKDITPYGHYILELNPDVTRDRKK